MAADDLMIDESENLNEPNYDAESMYSDDQQYFARGIANDIALSFTDIQEFISKRYPDMDTAIVDKIALTTAESWVHILIGRIMAQEMENDMNNPMDQMALFATGSGGGRGINGHLSNRIT